MACAYYGCNYAQTVKVFGLEDSPGEQRSSSASTISVRWCVAESRDDALRRVCRAIMLQCLFPL